MGSFAPPGLGELCCNSLPTPHARALDKYVVQGSLSSLAAFPPRRGLGGAAQENSDYLARDAEKARAAGRAAGPERGPCATRLRGISLEYFTHRLRSGLRSFARYAGYDAERVTQGRAGEPAGGMAVVELQQFCFGEG
jgi:hypothetical protein